MDAYFGIDLSPVGIESAVIDSQKGVAPTIIEPGSKMAAVAFVVDSSSFRHNEKSPALQLLQGSRLLFGEQAEKNFKNSKISQIATDFFDNPFSGNGAAGYSSLELSKKHIQGYIERLEKTIPNKAASCVCALPGSWHGELKKFWPELKSTISLGNVTAFNSGLLASSLAYEMPLPKVGPFYFIDITRQSASITTLEFNGSELRSVKTELIPEVGEAFFRDEILKFFVETLKTVTGKVPVQNRKDSQVLYDQIDPCLRLIDSEGVYQISIDDLQADISRESLALQLKKVWKPLYQKVKARVKALDEKIKPFFKVSSRVSIIPGFVEELKDIKNSVVECLPPSHLAMAACYFASNKEFIENTRDELVVALGKQSLLGYDKVTPFGFMVNEDFVTHKSVRTALKNTDYPTVFRTGTDGILRRMESPTHLLFQGRILPLSGEPFYVGSDLGKKRNGLQIVEDIVNLKKCHFLLEPQSDCWRIVSQGGVLLNHKEIQDSANINIGDIIEIRDTGLLFMVVKRVSSQLV